MKPIMTPERAGNELAKVLRLAKQKEEQLKDVTKERKGEIANLMRRARELQGIVLGDAVQVEMDTEPDERAGTDFDPVTVAKEAAAAVLAEAKKTANQLEVRGREPVRRERLAHDVWHLRDGVLEDLLPLRLRVDGAGLDLRDGAPGRVDRLKRHPDDKAGPVTGEKKKCAACGRKETTDPQLFLGPLGTCATCHGSGGDPKKKKTRSRCGKTGERAP